MNEATNKKRILMLNYEFPPLGGGGGVAAKALAKGFIKNGYDVDYVTSGLRGQKKCEVVDGIMVYRVPVIGRKSLAVASMISLLSFLISGFFQGVRLCRRHDYAFINTHFVVPTGPLGYVLSKMFRIKNVLSIHGGGVYDPTRLSSPHRYWISRTVVTFLMNRADRIVAQSSDTKKNAIKYYHPLKDIDIIPIPYETFVFGSATRQNLGLEEDISYTVSIGRLIKRKDFDFLIRSIARIKNKKVHALIIGDGPERENLLTLARELGIESRIHMLGHISDEEKFQYLSNADVFVLSSIHEGFGIVLQEAMQVGLPIIATNIGGQIDFVKNDRNGYLVTPGDTLALADKVDAVLRDKNSRDRFRNNNLHDVHNFSLTSIAAAYVPKGGNEVKGLKILCSTYWYPEYAGDIRATYVHDINRYLVTAGCQLSVVCPNYGHSSKMEKIDGVNIFRFNLSVPSDLEYGKVAQTKTSFLQRLIRILSMGSYIAKNFYYCYRIGKLQNVDIIHAHWAIPSGFPALLAARLLGVPCVITMHGGDVYYNPSEGYRYPKVWYIKPFLKFTLRQADKLTAITDDCRQHALKAGAFNNNIVIITNGTDLERFSTGNRSGTQGVIKRYGLTGEKVILSCRQLIPRKGMRYLIAAMPIVLRSISKTRLLIVGDGMERSNLEKQVSDLGLTDRIHFCGWIDNKDLPAYYNAAQVVVMPSLEEGFGIPAAEAMGCALPVVSTDAGGLVEVVQDGVTGLIVPKGNAVALGEAIVRVLSDATMAARMGEAGLIRAQKLFDWNMNAMKFVELYQFLLKKNRHAEN